MKKLLHLAFAAAFSAACLADEPDDYLEYVETTGAQYFDTGIRGKARLDVATKLAWTTVSSARQFVIGARNTKNGTGWFCAGRYSSKWSLHQGGDYTYSVAVETNVDYDVEISFRKDTTLGQSTVKVDGTAVQNRGSFGGDTELNAFLFAANENGTANYKCNLRSYGVKIYEDLVLTRDFKPAMKDGFPCLFDRVNGKLYYASGTNSAQLTAGPVQKVVEVSVEPADFAAVVRGGVGEQPTENGSFAFALLGDGPYYVNAAGDRRAVFTGCVVKQLGDAAETVPEASFSRTFAHSATAVWQFGDFERPLTVAAATGGSTTVDGTVSVGTTWAAETATLAVVAVPAAGYAFLGWKGDTAGCMADGATLQVPMTRARTLTPQFEKANRITLSVDKVSQRYPWNGLVDIDYTVAFADPDDALEPLSERLRILAVDKSTVPETVYGVHRLLENDLPATAGSHHVTWAANADGVDRKFDNVALRLEVVRYPERYATVDLSVAADKAVSFPVAFSPAIPVAVPDAYRLDRLLLRLIPPGRFWMGSPASEQGRNSSREAQHHVTLTEPFYLAVYETTVKQYRQVLPTSTAGSSLDNRLPVAALSYNAIRGSTLGARWPVDNQVDASSFMGVLRAKTGLAFDLPTEAEWEYACRAGTTTPFNDGVPADTNSKTYVTTYSDSMMLLGRFSGNYADGTTFNKNYTLVGSYAANGWGLYDMHGNVSEWCLDWHNDNTATLGLYVNPRGATTGSYRATRGGYYSTSAANCRSARRFAYDDGSNAPNVGRPQFGFRIALPASADAELPEPLVIASDEKANLSLDLSGIWMPDDLSAIPLAYSSVGWADDPVDVGRTVTLTYFKTNEDASVGAAIASGLSGRGTQAWTPAGVAKADYEVRHSVYETGKEVAAECLSAYFSFVNCQMEATPEEVLAAVLGVGEACAFTNDETHAWQPVGGAGEGIAAPAGVASTLSVAVSGAGTLTFDQSLAGGKLDVFADGALVATYDAVGDWQARTLVLDVRTGHVVTFSFLPQGDEAASAGLKDVSWATASGSLSRDALDGTRVDLREGVRAVSDRAELMPFVYSHTNFVGVAGATAASVARVSVVRLAPDFPTEDLSLWTNAVPGTARVLCREAGESSVVWRGKQGVWKAVFDILSGEDAVHTETAIFDMREFRPGFMLILK